MKWCFVDPEKCGMPKAGLQNLGAESFFAPGKEWAVEMGCADRYRTDRYLLYENQTPRSDRPISYL